MLENVASNAERRALVAGATLAVPRVLAIYAALPSITGKLELEYEGELKGGDTVARELIRLATGKVFTSYFEGENLNAIVRFLIVIDSRIQDCRRFESIWLRISESDFHPEKSTLKPRVRRMWRGCGESRDHS